MSGDAPAQVDLVVLTVIPPELSAVRQAFGIKKNTRKKLPEGTNYYTGTIHSRVAKRKYSVALIAIGQAGNPTAAVATANALSTFQPRAALLVGIAGGIRGEVKIGQSVIATTVHGYESAAYKTRAAPKPKKTAAAAPTKGKPALKPRSWTSPRPKNIDLDHEMSQDVTAWYGEATRTELAARIETRFTKIAGKFPDAPKGKKTEYRDHVCAAIKTDTAIVASGEKLFRDPRKLLGLQDLNGQITTVEMEAIGFVQACKHKKVQWLVVRGISDFGDHLKNDLFHVFAANIAACTAADFIAHGLDLRNFDPSSPTTTTFGADHVTGVRRELASVAHLQGRVLRDAADERATVGLGANAAEVPLETGGRVFVGGWSGRGKTSILRLLGSQALARSPPRIPVFLGPPDGSSLAALVARSLHVARPPAEAEVAAWMAKAPTLLIIDNWHRLDDKERGHVERLVTIQPSTFKTCFLFAGAESVTPPRLEGLRHYRVDKFTDPERRAFLIGKVGTAAPAVGAILAALPSGMDELLLEPVLLDKFATLVTSTSPPQTPTDLADLFRRLLETLAASTASAAPTLAAEIACVCGRLAGSAGPYDLPRLRAALQDCGGGETPAAFASVLVHATLWVPTPSGYEFSHEVWRRYFLARSLGGSAWGTRSSLVASLKSTDSDELLGMLPFVTSLMASPLHETLLDMSLRRDARLYARALRGLPTSHTLLSDLRRGYLAVANACGDAMKRLLEPWKSGDDAHELVGRKPIIVGRTSTVWTEYYFGFAGATSPDVVDADDVVTGVPAFAPGSVTRHGTQTRLLTALGGDRAGSALAVKKLIEVAKERDLPPIGWIARERLRTFVSGLAFHNVLHDDAVKMTPRQLAAWAREVRREHPDDARVAWRAGAQTIDVDTFIEVTDALIAGDLGETTVEDLGLPGPDETSGGRFVDRYSDTAKIERVTAMFRAVAETYRDLCERLFGDLRHSFLYAQFPARAVVTIDPVESLVGGWTMRWDVVKDWDAAPVVSVEESRLSAEELSAHADRTRLTCSRLGRPFLSFSVQSTVGSWGPLDEAVTEAVCDLLVSDLERIKGLLEDHRPPRDAEEPVIHRFIEAAPAHQPSPRLGRYSSTEAAERRGRRARGRNGRGPREDRK